MNRTFCTWFLRLGKDVSCVRVSHVPVPKNACEHLLVTKRMCMNQETRDRKCPCCLCKKHTQPPSLPGTPTVPEGALSAIPRQGGFSSRIWHQSLFVSCEKSLHRAHTHTHSHTLTAHSSSSLRHPPLLPPRPLPAEKEKRLENSYNKYNIYTSKDIVHEWFVLVKTHLAA